jgi:hypothetical protein
MNKTIRHWTTAIGSFALAGCASAGLSAPQLSASDYEAKAATEQREADAERSQFEPGAVATVTHCAHLSADELDALGMPCWTSHHNPTQQHLAEAARHRNAAEKFRARSQALVDAEATACIGISDHDRDTSPFAHTEDVVNIQPLDVAGPGGTLQREGAVFTFRALPGMTAVWLQRVMECHIARYSAMGHLAPDMEYCPLVPANVRAVVKPTAGGFAVEVSSGDRASVADILLRANALEKRRREGTP